MNKKYVKYCLLSLLITLIFFIPFYKHTIITVDLNYHLNRIAEIKNGIFSHSFPVYIYPYTNFEFGYGSPFFYCDLFFLFPAFLYILGLPLIVSYKVFIFIVCFLSTLAMIIVSDKIFVDKYITYISTILYSFSFIRIVDIATRGGAGSILAYASLPILLLGFHELFICEKDCWILIGVSFSFMLFSHIISFVLSCVLLLLLIIINIKKITKNQIFTILKGTGLAILLSAFFLFPFLEQLFSQEFWFSFISDTNGANYYVQSKMTLKEIFSDYIFDNDAFKYRVGTFVLLSYFALFFVSLYKMRIKRNNAILFFIIIVFLFTTSEYLPIELSKLFYSIQFVWRINTITIIIVIYEICNLLSLYNVKKTYLLLLIIYTSLNVGIKYKYNGIEENIPLKSTYSELFSLHEDWIRDTHNFNGWQIVSGEYLPYTNSYNYYEANKNIVFANEDTFSYDYKRIGTTIIFNSDYNNKEKVYMPLSYYKGYYYQELDSNGDILYEKECFPNEYSKRVGIDIEEGRHIYKVYYKGTIIQKISLFVSFLSFVILIIYLCKHVSNKRAEQ